MEVDFDKWEVVGEFVIFDVFDGCLCYVSMLMNFGFCFKFVCSKVSFVEDVIFDFVIECINVDGFGFSSIVELIDCFIICDFGFGFDILNLIVIMRDIISNGFVL